MKRKIFTKTTGIVLASSLAFITAIPAYASLPKSGYYTSGDETIDISECEITLEKKSVKYNGKPAKVDVYVTYDDEDLLEYDEEDEDGEYTLTYKNNTGVGTAQVIVTGVGEFEGSVTKTFKITRGTATITPKFTTKVKTSAIKKKNVTIKLNCKTNGGKLSYKLVKAKDSSRASISGNKLTLKKGAKAGKYVIKITSARTKNYNQCSKTVTVTIGK